MCFNDFLNLFGIDEEDFAKFQKAYEDLESHAQQLINMANTGPEQYLELQLKRKNKTTSVNPQGSDKTGPSSPRATVDQKNALAGNRLLL